MAVEADQVVVVLEADTADYEKKLSGASKVFEDETKKIEEAGKGAERATASSLGAIAKVAAGAALAIATAIAAGVKAFLNYADELDKTSKALGVTTDQLQHLRYAADVSGVSSDSLGKGLESLNDKLREASLGSEKPLKAFKALGLEIRDTSGNVKTLGNFFPQFADRVNAIVDPTQRAAVAEQFLGDAAEDMAPLLERGSAGINELANAADRLGIVLSPEKIKQAKDAADRFEDVRRVLSYEIMGVVNQNAEAIITLANAFATLAGNVGGAIQQLGILANMSGFRTGDRGSIDKLLSSKAGRDAMLNDIDERIKKNQASRANDRGASSGWSGVFEVRGKASQKERELLDREYKGLVRQRNAILAAESRIKPDVQVPNLRAPNVSGLLAPKGPTGPSADTLARRAEAERRRQMRDDVNFANEQDKIRMDILAAQTDILGTDEDRATLARAQVAAQRTIDERSLSLDFERSEVEKDALRLLYRQRETVELRAIAEEKRLRDMQRATDVSVNAIRRESELIELQGQMATTAEERRAIELKLLDLQYREAEERLKLLAASKDAVTAAEARKDLDALPGKKAAETDNINRRNQGPIGSYLESIPDTAAEINQALEEVAVGGLKDLEDGFARAATKALGLKGALGDVVAQMIKLVAQQLILMAVGGGGGSGGFLSSIFGGFRAAGGAVSAGKTYVVGEKGPELLQMGANSGNIVPNHALAARGGGGTTVIQNFNLDARYGVTTPELIEYVNNTAVTAGRAAVKQSRADLKAIGRTRLG